MLKERETYTATKGVENEGYEFETAMLLFYCLHLCYNNEINDFKIAIYDKHYHPFDDIVIDISTEITEKYAIQLKHVKDKLVLNSNHFGKNGKMVLSKYFKFDFTKSNHVVLFTNGVLNEEMTVNGCDIKAKKTLNFLEKCLDTCCEDCQHIYEVSNEGCDDKITFFTSQKNRNDIDSAIKRKLEEKFNLDEKNLDSVVQKLKSFFQQWKKGHDELCKLDKQDIKMKLAEILLCDSIVQFSPHFDSEIDPKIVILQNVIKSFTITVIDKTLADIDKLCCFNLDKNKVIELGQKLLVADFHEEKKISIILWRLKDFPLVIKITEENKRGIYEVINDLRDEHLNFILFGDSSKSDFDSSFNVLENLDDLKETEFYQKITQDFKLSIQGREEITIEELTKWNQNFGKIVTIKELCLMATGYFRVGEPQEDLPKPYIPRRLFFPILKIRIIEQFPNDLFAIMGREEILKKALPKNTFCKFEDCVTRTFMDGKLPPKTVILCRDEKDLKHCLDYKNRNVHGLKVLDEENLQLLFSKEKAEKLREFQIFLENQLFSLLPEKIKLIVARPGLGKLTMLKFLKKNAPPGHWTVKINLQEEILDDGDEFEARVKHCFKEVNRWIYFICGIDNLQNDENLVKTCNRIKELSRNYKVWVFSEDHLKEKLETLFAVPAMEIQEFTEDEQKEYITERLIERQKVEKVLLSFKMLRNNDILGAPMHLYMLTEIFLNDPKMEKVFILTEIYRYFIKTKYQHYLSKTCENNNNQIIEDGIYYRNEQYKLAAISCLDLEYFKKLKLQCDATFLSQIRSRGDVIGVIFRVSSDGGIIFSQETYSDYFAAIWLAENYHKVKDFEFIYRDDFKNILFMFNLEICKNNPAHISVLYQNFDELEKHESFFDDLDPLKRSVLHLSYCNGMKFPKIHITEDKTFKFCTKTSFMEDCDNKEIFDLLVKKTKIDPLQKDSLFGWDLIDYAFNLSNFYALEKLLFKFKEIHSVVLKKLCNSTDLVSVIYHSVKFGYENLLHLASKTPQFSSTLFIENCNGENLLYLAVKSGSCANTNLLLDKGANIDTTTSTYNKMSPLHAAVEHHHQEIVELLLKRKACVDVMDRYRSTPLHLAASKGLLNLARTLINFGADIDFADNFGRTPLQLAASFGHVSLVETLLDKGATIDKSDKLGNTPMSVAFAKKHFKICELLQHRGAKNDRKTSMSEFNEYIDFLLHWVASTGQVEQIESLLGQGWSINEVDHFGRTPLHRAVIEKHQQVVQVFLERGADVNISDNNKILPLCRAIFNNDEATTEFLVPKYLSVDFKDSFGYTPLHLAAMRGNVKIVKLLLTKNPDLDVCDIFGRRPVDCAVEGGHFGVVSLLGEDDLRVGIAKKMAEFLEVCETSDLSRGKLKSFGFSFKHLVAMFGQCEALERLKEELDFVDMCGNTALDWACKKGHVECVKILVDFGSVAEAIQGDFLDMAKKQKEFFKVFEPY
ncbi:uncharacterized protein LOC123008484 [Tribolium madens]|uniref:uncharacterized protein LOC123008484 n=1 Tax=Tribolium madens TaxID=41895 RepID=UPI001CF741E7|nr:uncharacterized protein LOC123008484 [Tribolium madens]